MEKSDRYHFTQMVKLKTTNLGRSQCLLYPQKEHITYEELLPENLAKSSGKSTLKNTLHTH